MTPALNLLTEPLIRAHGPEGGLLRLTLPEVLARLADRQCLDFVALRPHQRPAWHAFLVQLAYLALEAADGDAPPFDAEAWRRLLRGLTQSWPADEPWCLVVDGWQQPAFLQSPCAPGAETDYKKTLHSVQELDLLVTSKNHDEKVGKLAAPAVAEPDALVYALVSLQGFAGFLGAGNYNTMRMNGGFSSRPQFRLAVERGSGPEFARDVNVLLAHRNQWLNEARQQQIGSDAKVHRLLWLASWSDEPLSLTQVHALALEVCRRVRLKCSADGEHLLAMTASSKSARVDAKSRNGAVGDPWTPLVRNDKDGSVKALTAQPESFSYRHLAPVVFDRSRYILPLLALPDRTERGACTLVAQVLVGGSGRTDGLLQRQLTLTGRVSRTLRDNNTVLAERSQAFIQISGDLKLRVVRPALLQFMDGSKDPKWDNKDFGRQVDPWMARLDHQIDEAFFTSLFNSVEQEQDHPAAEQHWFELLLGLSRALLSDAMESLSTRDRSRYAAQERAWRMHRSSLYKHFRSRMPDSAAVDGVGEQAARDPVEANPS